MKPGTGSRVGACSFDQSEWDINYILIECMMITVEVCLRDIAAFTVDE